MTTINYGYLLGYLEQRRSITFLFHSCRLLKAICGPSGQLRYAAGTPQRVCSQLVATRSLLAEFISCLDSKDVWIDSSLLKKKRENISNSITISSNSSITFFVSLFPLVLIFFPYFCSVLFVSVCTCYVLQSVQLIWFTSCETEGLFSKNRPLTILSRYVIEEVRNSVPLCVHRPHILR